MFALREHWACLTRGHKACSRILDDEIGNGKGDLLALVVVFPLSAVYCTQFYLQYKKKKDLFSGSAFIIIMQSQILWFKNIEYFTKSRT